MTDPWGPGLTTAMPPGPPPPPVPPIPPRVPAGPAAQPEAPIVPGLPAVAGVPVVARTRIAEPHRHDRHRHLAPASWLLLVILAAQAALTWRLVRSDTASQGEAGYLWAGHLLWAHWLHGAPVPPFQAYLAGAPVIYPPIGALADSAAGLAGARLLSLAFMLAATALLWSATTRMFGRRAAFFAAALFAAAGPVLQLGAFATGDAMGVCLVALTAWCAVRAGEREDSTAWMILAGFALALANATAYWSALFDPVLLALTFLIACPTPGGKAALGRAATLLTVLATLVTIGTLVGGGYYVTGVHHTLSMDVSSTNPALLVARKSALWLGPVAALALAGVAVGVVRLRGLPRMWLLVVLAAAAFIVPVEQAGLRTALSLNVHVTLGAWFAAVPAGYAVDALVGAVTRGWTRAVVAGACVTALAFPFALGLGQSSALAASWPNASSFLSIFGPLADHGHGHLLVEDPEIAEYYLNAGMDWRRWSTTRNIVLSSGRSIIFPNGSDRTATATAEAEFAHYVATGYFSLVALDFADTTALDHRIDADLRANHHYHVIDVVPYGNGTYVVWQYQTIQSTQQYEPRLGGPVTAQRHKGGR
jgi:dolichyl-phosphate-mannose-protein mannosyltransferase